MSDMILTGKQKAYLKKLSHDMTPIFHVGKGVVSDNLVNGISEALYKRELIKINLLQNCLDDAKSVAITISEKTDSNIIQVIGRTIVLYKKNEDDPKILL